MKLVKPTIREKDEWYVTFFECECQKGHPNITRWFTYCPDCGNKIDWEGVER